MRSPRLLPRLLLPLLVAASIATARASDPPEARQILAELASIPLPRVDVAAMADPNYAAAFTKQRDAVRAKRAELILESYRAAPASTPLALLSERWQTLAQADQVSQAVAEMSAYVSSNADGRDRSEAAYERALLIIQKQARDTSARLAAIEEFGKLVPPEQADKMLPQLLYRTGRLASDPKERDQLLARVVHDYPDSSGAKVVRGATQRQEAVGKTMEMSFNDAVTGTPIDIKDFRGKIVVVDFWAAWCTDCAAEMPYMKKIYADFKDKGVVFIGVSLDLPESDGGLTTLKAAVVRHQLKWPQYYLGNEWDSDFSVKWGVFAVPSVFVVDRQGKVVNTDADQNLERILTVMLKTPGD